MSPHLSANDTWNQIVEEKGNLKSKFVKGSRLSPPPVSLDEREL